MAFTPGRPPEWEPFLNSLPGARELSILWDAQAHAHGHVDIDGEMDVAESA